MSVAIVIGLVLGVLLYFKVSGKPVTRSAYEARKRAGRRK